MYVQTHVQIHRHPYTPNIHIYIHMHTSIHIRCIIHVAVTVVVHVTHDIMIEEANCC